MKLNHIPLAQFNGPQFSDLNKIGGTRQWNDLPAAQMELFPMNSNNGGSRPGFRDPFHPTDKHDLLSDLIRLRIPQFCLRKLCGTKNFLGCNCF